MLETRNPIEVHNVAVTLPLDPRDWRVALESDVEAQEHLDNAKKRKKGYKIFQGALYYENRLYVPKSKRHEILTECHQAPPAAHGGVRVTAMHAKSYWWPSMANDIRKYVLACEICQARKISRDSSRAGECHAFEAYEPWELVCADCLGPLPESARGYKHVLVAVDCFTHFVCAKAIPNEQGATIALALAQLIGQFGIPRVFLSDNGPAFKNEFVAQLASTMQFELRRSTPQHHRGNALAENAIKNLQEKMALITHDPAAQTDWEVALPTAVLSMNTSEHSRIGFTAFELMFGRSHRIASDIVGDARGPQRLWAELLNARHELHNPDVILRREATQNKYREEFAKQHAAKSFEIGEKVWVLIAGRRAKLQNRYQGPYVVVARANDIYSLQSCDERAERLERHVSQLKRLYVPSEDELTSNPDSDDEEETVIYDSSQPATTPASVNIIQASTDRQSAGNIVRIQQLTKADILLKRPSSMRVVGGVFLALCIVLMSTANCEFVKAPVVAWIKTNRVVSPTQAQVNQVIRFGSPCATLRMIPVATPEEKQRLLDQCELYYRIEVVERLKRLAVPQEYQHQTVMHSLLSQNRPTLSKRSILESGIDANVSRTILRGKQSSASYASLTAGSRASEVAPESVDASAVIDHQAATHYLDHPVIGSSDNVTESRVAKRSLGLELLAYSTINNAIETVCDRIWPSKAEKLAQELADKVPILQRELQQLTMQTNYTRLQLDAYQIVMETTHELVQNNVQRIHDLTAIQSTYPKAALLISALIGKLNVIGVRLENLRTSMRARRLDVRVLASLTGNDELLDVDESSINSVLATLLDPETIKITFTARKRSADVSVYQVNSFRVWDLAADEPTLMTYAGPKFMVHNRTASCLMGIADPMNDWVSATCPWPDHFDPRLDSKEVDSSVRFAEAHKLATQIRDLTSEIHVYCYTQQISVAGQSFECPPFPFKISPDVEWSTPTFAYKADKATLFSDRTQFTTLESLMDFSSAAKDNATIEFDEAIIVKKLREARQLAKSLNESLSNLSSSSTAVVLDKGYSYKLLFIGLAALNVLAVALVVACRLSARSNWCTAKARGRQQPRATEMVLRDVVRHRVSTDSVSSNYGSKRRPSVTLIPSYDEQPRLAIM